MGEQQDSQHSPPSRSDPDLLSREEVTPNQEDPASSDSLPDTYIFTPCSTPPEVHSSPEHPPQRRPDDFGLLEIHKYEMSTASEWGEEEDCQHSPPNRSDPDLLSREEVTPNQESVSLGPDAETSQSAARHPVDCSNSFPGQSSSSNKRKSNHPQKESNKRIRKQSTSEDQEASNSSRSSDED